MKTTHDRRVLGPRHLEVRHLRLVRAIADSGGVTRAAGALHLSQSAVSHQLRDLERDLATRLFDRVGKRMVPTPAGDRLLEGSRRLLADLADLERAIDTGRDARVPLRVTSSCFTSYTWLPAALAQFATAHPAIELDIVIEATRRSVAALAADEVDFAIITDPPRDDDTWESTPVIASELVALAMPRHPVCSRLRRGALRWSALRDCEILVPDISDHDLARLDEAVRRSWEKESGERLANPITVRKIPLSEPLLELARAGAGVAIIDRWTVAPHLDRRLRALPLVPAAPRTFHAVWRRTNPRQLPMHELTTIVRTHGARAIAGLHDKRPRRR